MSYYPKEELEKKLKMAIDSLRRIERDHLEADKVYAEVSSILRRLGERI